MSFQRIFELVRRQGMPLVVTDEGGKEPLVVLPFDMYEALMEGGESKPEIKAMKKENLAPSPDTEISLEERFYIETLEDQENR